MTAPPPAPTALRVLVVEDEESDYALLLAHLKRSAFAVESHRVWSAEAMRTALRAASWDLIISDYNMPGFGALPALEVRADGFAETPFILMSGAIGEEAAAEAMRVGADDFVPKGRPDRLGPAIRRSLAAVAMRRARARAEAFLSGVAANLPGLLFRLRTTTDGRVLAFQYLSDGVRDLFGVSPYDAMQDAELLMARFGAAERERFEQSLSAAARDVGLWRGEFRVSAPAGERWVQWGASPRADERALVWDGIATDITAAKAAETRILETQEQLRNLTAHLQHVREEERSALAREVHDHIGGLLTAMRADVATLGKRVEGNAPAAERLASLEALLAEAMRASQSIARVLRPAALDQGLHPALVSQAREFQARHGIPCRVESNEPELQLDLERATALFRISQEALTNIAKHARAGQVTLTLFSDAEQVTLEIRDDGRGIEPRNLDKTGSFGIFGMNERMRFLGGWLEVDGAPGQGTTLMACVPRRAGSLAA